MYLTWCIPLQSPPDGFLPPSFPISLLPSAPFTYDFYPFFNYPLHCLLGKSFLPTQSCLYSTSCLRDTQQTHPSISFRFQLAKVRDLHNLMVFILLEKSGLLLIIIIKLSDCIQGVITLCCLETTQIILKTVVICNIPIIPPFK